MSYKPERCPECGATAIAEIMYGLPDFNDDLNRQLDEGRVVLGGCVVSDDAPKWRCNECRLEFGTLKL
ncbi:MAG: hypothetical protein R3C10_18865 [Pirellulales bacterium]